MDQKIFFNLKKPSSSVAGKGQKLAIRHFQKPLNINEIYMNFFQNNSICLPSIDFYPNLRRMFMAVLIEDCKSSPSPDKGQIPIKRRNSENCENILRGKKSKIRLKNEEVEIPRPYDDSPIPMVRVANENVTTCPDCGKFYKISNFLNHKQSCKVDVNRNLNPNYRRPLQESESCENSSLENIAKCKDSKKLYKTCNHLNQKQNYEVDVNQNLNSSQQDVDEKYLTPRRKSKSSRNARFPSRKPGRTRLSNNLEFPRIKKTTCPPTPKVSNNLEFPRIYLKKLSPSKPRPNNSQQIINNSEFPRIYIKRLSTKVKCSFKNCEKSFNSPEHQELPPKLKCYHEKCGKSFDSLERLQRHKRIAHPLIIQCPERNCAKKLKISYLSKHIFYVHKRPTTICDICDQKVLLSTLRYHVKKCKKKTK